MRGKQTLVLYVNASDAILLSTSLAKNIMQTSVNTQICASFMFFAEYNSF